MTHHNLKKSGFTLVELSIVLVIIGLIVGGVVGGQSLIFQSKLRTIASDISKYRTAVNAFQLQYDALPGDMTNAYDYWGVAAGCTNVNVNSSAAGCNGNGDNRIYTHSTDRESLRAWQHLSLAKVIPGNFSGVRVGGSAKYKLGRNAPSSSFDDVGYRFYNWEDIGGMYGQKGNLILVAGVSGSTVDINKGFLSPSVAKQLDTKIDDGLAYSGNMNALRGYEGSTRSVCVTGYTGATSVDWILTDNTESCRLVFWLE